MPKIRVLFLCTGNSCRSQIAEGFLKYMGGERFEVFSAGTDLDSLNPLAVKIMAEKGIDISKQYAKPLSLFLGEGVDYVITLCFDAGRNCPDFPGASRKLHWDIKDPAQCQGDYEDKMKMFREVRNEIESRIKDFLRIHNSS